jgi:hypothetical protein
MKKREKNPPFAEAHFPTQITIHEPLGPRQPKLSTKLSDGSGSVSGYPVIPPESMASAEITSYKPTSRY